MSSPPLITGLTDTESLHRYLDSKSIKATSIAPLTGGTANFVFRIITEEGVSRIVKHAEPYVASSNGAVPFPLESMDFEVTALKKIGTLLPEADSVVTIPEVFDYDEGLDNERRRQNNFERCLLFLS